MRYALISDLHANLQAFDAIYTDAAPNVDTFVCLGDVVGYNANPTAILDRVRKTCSLVIAGNHDQAACDPSRARYFNGNARKAIDWTRNQLSQSDLDYLAALPTKATFGDADQYVAGHGAPEDTDTYLKDSFDFQRAFHQLDVHHPKAVCAFIGHTHVQMAWRRNPDGAIERLTGNHVAFTPGYTCFVNPGSVGQPRDRYPTAAYAILDDDARTIHFHRVAYDVKATQTAIHEAGLPDFLADRLAVGR